MDYPLGKSSQGEVPWDYLLGTSFQTAVPWDGRFGFFWDLIYKNNMWGSTLGQLAQFTRELGCAGPGGRGGYLLGLALHKDGVRIGKIFVDFLVAHRTSVGIGILPSQKALQTSALD